MDRLKASLKFLSHRERIGTFPLWASYQESQLLSLALGTSCLYWFPLVSLRTDDHGALTLLLAGVAMCPSAVSLQINYYTSNRNEGP